MIKRVLITGANAGLGKESARQLALQDGIEKIYLAARNEAKAKVAQRELEGVTGKSIFEIVLIDVSNLKSVRAAVESLDEPIDALVMNAGGTGGRNFADRTADGVTQQFAVNVLGHVVLLEALLKAKKLTQVALYAGSEAARGVPKMGVKRPKLKTSSVDEFVSIIDGSFFAKTNDPLIPYGPVKYVAALWMSSLARQYPEVRLVTVSPGSTSGTNGGEDLAPLMKFIFTKIGPILLPMFGLMHKVELGAKRYVDVLNDKSYKSGVFYASEAPTLTGPLVDQGTIFADLNNRLFQDNANKAIHRFIS
ncbi:MAG: SDR family NAD(P)-dependent oxidoreductase [Chloroflexota bacterium]